MLATIGRMGASDEAAQWAPGTGAGQDACGSPGADRSVAAPDAGLPRVEPKLSENFPYPVFVEIGWFSECDKRSRARNFLRHFTHYLIL